MIFSWTGNRGGQGSAHNFQRAPGKWRDLKGGGLDGDELENQRKHCFCFFFFVLFSKMWMMLSPFMVQYYNWI